IGVNTLKVASSFPALFEVTALSAGSNIELLNEQIKKFKPKIVCVKDETGAYKLKQALKGSSSPLVYSGVTGLIKLIRETGAELIVVAVVGGAGLVPVLESIKCGKNIALANKESLVSAGSYIMKEAAKKKVEIIPIDSEHSAIFQCLKGEKNEKIRRIILTASGGPFRDYSRQELEKVKLEDALDHPTWDMGDKVTIDSATLMNKGFEVLEAHHLFGIPVNRIDVVIHPQSVVHSLVEFVDGSVLAQLGVTDMRIPIQYALAYPERFNNNFPRLNLTNMKALTFSKPDTGKFECLAYAYAAAKAGGTMPAVLSAASETAVDAFLAKEIGFTQIAKIIKKVMTKHKVIINPKLKEILSAETQARSAAEKEIENGKY
ncbi:MAG: 1-deoxy-D-xylulose-5-phosphate reductoisomerase, partial [Candidatus Firestonebacteria bacterium]